MNQQNHQTLQDERYNRLQTLGYKGPVGGGLTEGDVNGNAHSPAVRRQYGDVLSGQFRQKYQEMFSKKSKTGPSGFNPIPVKPHNGAPVDEDKKVSVADFSSGVDRSNDSELSAIDKMFDPDYGSGGGARLSMSPRGEIGANLDNYGPNWNAMNVSNQLQNRLQQKQTEMEQPLTQSPVQQQPAKSNALSYRDFASDKQGFASEVSPVAESTPEVRKDYKAHQNYMYHMNEAIIREIAEEIASKTVKSVLAEHIKTERSKYVFERVTFKKKDGTLVELLKKDDKYFELTTIETAKGNFTALKERKVSPKKRKY